MSTSRFSLTVESSDPFAIVEIAGADYALRAKGGQNVSYEAPPGLYIARAKFRDHIDEQLVHVRNKHEHVWFPPPASAEPKLFDRTPSSALSSQVALSRVPWAGRSWITIAIRGLKSARSRELGYPGLRVTDFFVHDLYGNNVTSFQSSVLEQALPATSSPGVYPGEVASVEVNPGWYALSMPASGESRVMLPIYVADRFSPTIFIETSTGSESGEVIDFDKLLVKYDPDEQNGLNDAQELEAIEAARRSLELGRNTLTQSLMRVLLRGKMSNPMLGLLALQMLLLPEAGRRKKEPPATHAGLFEAVSTRVSCLLGAAGHPDLVMARAQARRLKWPISQDISDDMPLIAPPLLKANWRFFNSIKSRRHELTRKDGLLYDVGRSLLQAGVWVVWKPPSGDRPIYQPRLSLQDVFLGSGLPLRQSGEQRSVFDALITEEGMPAYAARPKRKTPDEQLEDLVNLIRSNEGLQNDLLKELSSSPPSGSVLDRTVVKTVLQLASFDPELERSVPRGYVSKLARGLSVPRLLVCDSIVKVEKALAGRTGLGRGLLVTDSRSLLP